MCIKRLYFDESSELNCQGSVHENLYFCEENVCSVFLSEQNFSGTKDGFLSENNIFTRPTNIVFERLCPPPTTPLAAEEQRWRPKANDFCDPEFFILSLLLKILAIESQLKISGISFTKRDCWEKQKGPSEAITTLVPRIGNRERWPSSRNPLTAVSEKRAAKRNRDSKACCISQKVLCFMYACKKNFCFYEKPNWPIWIRSETKLLHMQNIKYSIYSLMTNKYFCDKQGPDRQSVD